MGKCSQYCGDDKSSLHTKMALIEKETLFCVPDDLMRLSRVLVHALKPTIQLDSSSSNSELFVVADEGGFAAVILRFFVRVGTSELIRLRIPIGASNLSHQHLVRSMARRIYEDRSCRSSSRSDGSSLGL